jgi:hypothetical protein
LEFGRDVLTQALGTAVGGVILAVGAKVIGALGDVPWNRVILGLATVAAFTAAGAWLDRRLNAKLAEASGEVCPNCGEQIPAPMMSHGGGSTGMAMHSKRECPKCGEPLIYFTEGELAGEWRIDDAEKRRRKLRKR